jgi:hypothetical protein
LFSSVAEVAACGGAGGVGGGGRDCILSRQSWVARDLLLAGIGMSPLFAALLLPINTPLRGRIFRYGKWVALTLAVVLLLGRKALKWSWLLISGLLADGEDGVDAGFDPAETSGVGLAAAFVSLRVAAWGIRCDHPIVCYLFYHRELIAYRLLLPMVLG